MTRMQGTVLAVVSEAQGGTCLSWQGTQMMVADASDFSREGGQFTFDGETVYSYLGVTEGVEDAPDVVLTVDSGSVSEESRVDLWPLALEVTAEVQTDTDDSLPCVVPHMLRPLLVDGLRGSDRENVVIERRGQQWVVIDVVGRAALVQADALDPSVYVEFQTIVGERVQQLEADLAALQDALGSATPEIEALRAALKKDLDTLRADLSAADAGLASSLADNRAALDGLSQQFATTAADVTKAQADAKAAAEKAASAESSAQAANTAALDAAGIAQGKGKVLAQNTEPPAADRNSVTLWIDTANGNTPKRWDGSKWVAVTDRAAVDAAAAAAAAQSTADQAKANAATAQTAADAAKAAAAAADLKAATAQSTADTAKSNAATAQTAADAAKTAASKAQTDASKALTDAANAAGASKAVAQSSAPADRSVLWIDTTGGANTPKVWNGSTWTALTDKAATDAATKAATAQTAADQAKTAASAAQTTADQAKTDAAKAQKAADDAAAAAGKAQTTADTALASANGKNTNTWSTNAPSGSGKVTGDIWWQLAADGGILGEWAWTGSTWASRPIRSEAIAYLDAAKITTGFLDAARLKAGTITADKLTVNTLLAETIAGLLATFQTVFANKVTANMLYADQSFANKLVATMGSFQSVFAGVVTAGMLKVDQALAEKITATMATFQSVFASKVTASMLAVDALNGKTIEGGDIWSPSRDSAPRVHVGGGVVEVWRSDGEQDYLTMQFGGEQDQSLIYDAQGNQVAGFAPDGAGVARTMDVDERLTVSGTDVMGAIESLPGGLMQPLVFALPSNTAKAGTTELGVCDIGFTAQPGRLYRVEVDAYWLIPPDERAQVYLRARTAGSGVLDVPAPTISTTSGIQNAIFHAGSRGGNLRGGFVTYWQSGYALPSGVRMLLTMRAMESGSTGVSVGSQGWMSVTDLGAYDGNFTDGQINTGGGVPISGTQSNPTTSKVTYTSVWNFSHVRSWQGSTQVTDALQFGNYGGIQRYGMAWFINGAISGEKGKTPAQALSGASNVKLSLRMTNQHFYSSTGGTVRIGHNNQPTSAASPQTSGGDAFTSPQWAKGSLATFALPSGWASGFASGAYTGVTLGEGAGTAAANYGKARTRNVKTNEVDPSLIQLVATYTR